VLNQDTVEPLQQVEDISQYNEVREEDSPTSTNQYLTKGWKLLGVFPNHSSMKDHFPVVYILGRHNSGYNLNNL
jgi:hypothetical protein